MSSVQTTFRQPGGAMSRNRQKKDSERTGKKHVRPPDPSNQSGHNPSVPVQRYETAPNRGRFRIGDPVILSDTDYLSPYVGHVLGFAGGTHVWVRWPHVVDQHPVQELINIHPERSEWAFSGNPRAFGAVQRGKSRPPRNVASRRSGRQASNPWLDPSVVQRLRDLGVHAQDIHHVARYYAEHASRRVQPQSGVPSVQSSMTPSTTSSPPGEAHLWAPTTDVTMAPNEVDPEHKLTLQSRDELTPHQRPAYVHAARVRRAGLALMGQVQRWLQRRNTRLAHRVHGSAIAASALSYLYESGQRSACGDSTARTALKNLTADTLRVADTLRRRGSVKAAERLEVGLVNALAYPQEVSRV